MSAFTECFGEGSEGAVYGVCESEVGDPEEDELVTAGEQDKTEDGDDEV